MADQPSGEKIAAQVAEAQKLRVMLERLAVQGLFDLSKPEIRTAHERLDWLERAIYQARHA